MERYRAYGQEDDQPLVVGDEHFLGVDEYNNPENVQPAYVQKAVNCSFSTMNAETRGGFVCLPELGASYFNNSWIKTGSEIAGINDNWTGVVYGNSLFVAVSNNTGGTYQTMTSTDGVTWTGHAAAAALQWKSVAYGNGVFVAVASTGTGNRVMTSPDGITWTSRTSAADYAWTSVAYGNGIFVAVADSLTTSGKFAMYSTNNGVTWSTSGIASKTINCSTVAYGNGQFVAMGYYGVSQRSFVSTDGINWTEGVTSISDTNWSLAYGNGRFVAVDSDSISPRSAYSDDGLNWTLASTPGTFLGWKAIAFGNGRFIAINSGGTTAATSSDGINWSIQNLATIATYGCVAYGAQKFVTLANVPISAYACYLPDTRVWASSIYSDPNEIGTSWIMVLGLDSVGFYAFGHTSRSVSLGSYTVNEQSTIVQANNYVYIFRGDNAVPLYWNGDWNTSFTAVPNTTLPATYNSIPNSNQATYYQNRLWIRSGKDSLAASDVLAFSDYDPLANEFNLNTGNSDYVVATFPFGLTSLVCFKNKSIQLLQQVDGALTDVIVTEITRQVGLVGINAVTSVGPDLAYVSYGNINLLTLTSTNNAMQHKTLPLSSRIRRIMNRVNWQVGYKISLGYWNNKLYVSLPLDNSLFCNAVVVYNFITESWYGEWNFSPDMNMCIQGWQVNDYLGLQRLHAITEDGRIFVTDEGQNDISGTTVSEISFELVTRAYSTNKGNNESRATSINHFQRRMFADLSTNRPKFSVSSYTDGANEESVLLTDQTYTRSQSWLFSDAAYDLTNANNDYNRPYRRDYSTGPASVQSGTGFQPEMTQDIRIPMITQRQGRLSWLSLTNTQGYLMLKSIGFENRAGQRGSTIQA